MVGALVLCDGRTDVALCRAESVRDTCTRSGAMRNGKKAERPQNSALHSTAFCCTTPFGVVLWSKTVQYYYRLHLQSRACWGWGTLVFLASGWRVGAVLNKSATGRRSDFL